MIAVISNIYSFFVNFNNVLVTISPWIIIFEQSVDPSGWAWMFQKLVVWHSSRSIYSAPNWRIMYLNNGYWCWFGSIIMYTVYIYQHVTRYLYVFCFQEKICLTFSLQILHEFIQFLLSEHTSRWLIFLLPYTLFRKHAVHKHAVARIGCLVMF